MIRSLQYSLSEVSFFLSFYFIIIMNILISLAHMIFLETPEGSKGLEISED